MMRMQPEAEGYSGQVSCGGAARRLDVSALSELRNRVAGAHDALDDASSAGARTANAPSFATAAAMSAEAVAEDDGLDARRRILRRRVLLALAASVAILATACWEYLPGILAWLADPQAVRSFVADHSVISRLVMLGINVTQIFLAFLPGEPVELASGSRLASGRGRRCVSSPRGWRRRRFIGRRVDGAGAWLASSSTAAFSTGFRGSIMRSDSSWSCW